MRSVYASEADSAHHHEGCGCASCCEHSRRNDDDNESVRDSARAGAGAVSADLQKGKSLLSGQKWDTNDLTYAFPNNPRLYDTDAAPGVQYGAGEAMQGFSRLNAKQEIAAEASFDQYAAVSGLTFRKLEPELGAEATLRLAQSMTPSTAWGYYPSDTPEGGDAWLGLSNGYFSSPELGTYAWHTIMHEIGHALGLSHGHEGFGALSKFEDTMEQSIMTYRSYVGDTLSGGYANERFGYAQTIMQADIAAIQVMYGANFDHNSGDTTYRWDVNTGEMFVDGAGVGAPGDNRIFSTLWDGGGHDTLDLGDYHGGISVNLQPGAGSVFSQEQRAWLNKAEGGDPVLASGNVWMSRLYEGDTRSLIEDVKGGRGDDKIIGNSADNKFIGGWGSDTLGGGRGEDHLVGRGGNDLIRGARHEDTIKGGVGDDTLRGGRDGDWINGGGGSDLMFGARGDDTIVAGRGDDQMRGGSGSDVFVFRGDGGRNIIHDFEDGIDLIRFVGLRDTLDGVEITHVNGGVNVTYDTAEIFLRGGADMTIDSSDFIL